MVCPVCLESLDNGPIKELSCGHKYHWKCFMDIVNRGKNLYIKCPTCRQVNTNTKKPFNTPEENIKFLSYPLRKRCICKTKKGLRCKNKPRFLNYGMCHIHNKEYLEEKSYKLMEEFIYLTLEQRNNLNIRISVIDVGKQIIMKKLNETDTISDLLKHFYEFYSVKDVLPKDSYHNDLYNYYGLKRPPKEWIKLCNENYKLY
tara:strand:- start:2837 stop:3442 length:606 start_codon:yes stop_codon:yes gene_type:complete